MIVIPLRNELNPVKHNWGQWVVFADGGVSRLLHYYVRMKHNVLPLLEASWKRKQLRLASLRVHMPFARTIHVHTHSRSLTLFVRGRSSMCSSTNIYEVNVKDERREKGPRRRHPMKGFSDVSASMACTCLAEPPTILPLGRTSRTQSHVLAGKWRANLFCALSSLFLGVSSSNKCFVCLCVNVFKVS